MAKKQKKKSEEKGPVEEDLEEGTIFEVPKEEKKAEKESLPKQKIKSAFLKEHVVTENSNEARELYNQSRYGTLTEDGKLQISLIEAMYLLEKGRITLQDSRNREIKKEDFLKKAIKSEPNFWARDRKSVV